MPHWRHNWFVYCARTQSGSSFVSRSLFFLILFHLLRASLHFSVLKDTLGDKLLQRSNNCWLFVWIWHLSKAMWGAEQTSKGVLVMWPLLSKRSSHPVRTSCFHVESLWWPVYYCSHINCRLGQFLVALLQRKCCNVAWGDARTSLGHHGNKEAGSIPSLEKKSPTSLHVRADDSAVGPLRECCGVSLCVQTVSTQEQQNNLSPATKTKTSVNSKPNICSLSSTE